MTFSHFFVGNTLNGKPLPTHFISSKMPSHNHIRRREFCCVLLVAAALVTIGYTAKNMLDQNVTSSLEGRISKISSDANTITCPNWTEFSASFNGPDGKSYTVHCENGHFPFIIQKGTPFAVNIDYASCVTESADSSGMDISCVSELLLQKGEDNDLPVFHDLDDLLLSGSECTDDDLHQAPCSEIYPDNPIYKLRGSGNQS